MLRLGEFFRVLQLVASTKRVVSFQSPSSPYPFSYHPRLPSPPPVFPLPVYFQRASLLHVANASSPQLPPADAYTLPRSHTHHLLLRLGLGTRLYGHVTYEREGVCRVLASSRAGAQFSA